MRNGTKLFSLNPERFTNLQRLEFVETFGKMLYSGQGSTSNFSRQLGVTEADGLRVLLGVPDIWLTIQRRRLFEAMYSYMAKEPIKQRPDLWVEGGGWVPKNPRRSEGRPLDECRLDFDFVESLGIRRSVWEKEILMTTYQVVSTKYGSGGSTEGVNMRLYMGLALFGFSEPEQFFV